MQIKTFILLIINFIILNCLFADNAPLWLRYPDISPDGKFIVFCYKGDIYKVSTDGGEAIPLTVHTAYDYMPKWSPDGSLITFASDRNGNFDIYTIPSDGGTATRLTYYSLNEYPNSFTPDGKSILFSAHIMDLPDNVLLPTKSAFSELYTVPVTGGRIQQILSTPAVNAVYNNDMTKIIYEDVKGFEDEWRKHHTSSITKDLWIFDITSNSHTKLSTFIGEDRNPVLSSDEKNIYYTTEQFNSNFNIAKFSIDNPSVTTQITNFEKHPVRFLSISDNDILCFSFDGEIYIKKSDNEPVKVKIEINIDGIENDVKFESFTSGATEMNVSPDGKEVVFVVRGDVYVSSVKYSTTKQITNTSEQERSVSFSPDGRAILYASEKNGSWNIYQTKLVREDEKSFSHSTLLSEEEIIATDAEEFQPEYSPDGKEVAYLENRTTLKVINLDSKKTRTVLAGTFNYSYSDGDQYYDWSPDSKWFLVEYTPFHLFMDEVGLVSANGDGNIINLTTSGYSDGTPKWTMNGQMMIWFTDRQGMRSHGSWGSQWDIYGMFFTKESYDEFIKTKEEVEIEEKSEIKTKDSSKVSDIIIEFDGLEDRIERLTINSSSISDAILSPDGEKLYYLCKFDDGYDLWVHEFKENETKLVTKLTGFGKQLKIDKSGTNLFLFSGTKIVKISTKDYSKETLSFTAEKYLDLQAERVSMFDHVWRLIKEKFYIENLHNTDWEYYKTEYAKFLPFINNNYDYSEMLSEMLGELNASHTGSGYITDLEGDETAKLGAFYDWNFTDDGLKIVDIIEKGPLTNSDSKIEIGTIIKKIDGNEIKANQDYFYLFNHKSGKSVLLSLYNPSTKKTWEEVVKPITITEENNLLYDRWVKQRQTETEKLSNGRIGYVHVKAMNEESFREVYSEMLGKYYDKEAIIVDTRYNSGGWLHDDLITLLSGVKYAEYCPRGQKFGSDPMSKWIRPSIVLINESNYSDAHAFPYAYSTLGLGKTVGMPIPGTMTAVWWETLQDKSLYFGIPQVGALDLNGNYLENQQLEPDYKIANDYNIMINGRDQQLEKAVEVLLDELNK